MKRPRCISNPAREAAAQRGFVVLIGEALPPKRPVGGFRAQRQLASHEMRWIEFALLGGLTLPAFLTLAL